MRVDELFAFPAERTQFSDELYAALGRAVAFCTLFEANCRVVAQLLGLKARAEGEPLTQDVIDDLLREIRKRRLAQHIDTVMLRLGLPSEARQVFQHAREARNSITHEFALGVEHDVETDSGRERRLRELGDLVTHVASADRLVCHLGQHLTHEELPPAAFVQSYPTLIRAWICDVTE